MTSVTDDSHFDHVNETEQKNLSLPLARRAKERRVRAASTGAADMQAQQLLTKIRDVTLIQASDAQMCFIPV